MGRSGGARHRLSDLLLGASFAVATIALVILGLGPVPEVGFVLQFAGVSGLVGSLVGLVRQRSDEEIDLGKHTGLGGLGGTAFGVLAVLFSTVS